MVVAVAVAAVDAARERGCGSWSCSLGMAQWMPNGLIPTKIE